MTKYQPINGRTKETIIAQFKKYNKGTRAMRVYESHPHQSPRCTYEAHDGNRCAVGAFIPDGHPALKSPQAVSILLHEFESLWAQMPLDINGLVELQGVHDGCSGNAHEVIEAWVNANVA